MSIRLVVADDHPIVLQGLRGLFARHQDFSVVRCCQTSCEAIDAVRTDKPDVLVLDLRMPPNGGLDVLRTISEESLSCRTVVLTAAARRGEAAAVLRLGALGIVLKESPPEALLACVREVHEGRRWIDRGALPDVPGPIPREGFGTHDPAPELTAREIDIVRKLATGCRNRDIARDLAISEGTVKIHLHRIYDKLGLNGRLELVLYAQENGVL